MFAKIDFFATSLDRPLLQPLVAKRKDGGCSLVSRLQLRKSWRCSSRFTSTRRVRSEPQLWFFRPNTNWTQNSVVSNRLANVLKLRKQKTLHSSCFTLEFSHQFTFSHQWTTISCCTPFGMYRVSKHTPPTHTNISQTREET